MGALREAFELARSGHARRLLRYRLGLWALRAVVRRRPASRRAIRSRRPDYKAESAGPCTGCKAPWEAGEKDARGVQKCSLLLSVGR